MPSALPTGPARKPAHVLLGLTRGANFLCPKAMPPSMEKLSPMKATTNGISTNDGPMFRSSAMKLYMAGKRNAATMQTATDANGMAFSVPCVWTAVKKSAITYKNASAA